MTKRTIIALIGTAIIALVAGMQIARLYPSSQSRDFLPTSAPTDHELPMTVVSLSETTKLYAIRGEYPQFTSTAKSLSTMIATDVNARIAEFKKNATENWKARQDTTPTGQPKEANPTTPFDFIATWEPKQLNTRTISLIVRIYAYEGGAHGNSELKTYNYNVQTGSPLSLASLFPDDPNYLAMLSKYAYDRLLQYLTTASDGHVQMDMLKQGTAPTPDNFKNFTFNDNAITFYFPKYQVAPGVFGEQTVMFGRTTTQ